MMQAICKLNSFAVANQLLPGMREIKGSALIDDVLKLLELLKLVLTRLQVAG